MFVSISTTCGTLPARLIISRPVNALPPLNERLNQSRGRSFNRFAIDEPTITTRGWDVAYTNVSPRITFCSCCEPALPPTRYFVGSRLTSTCHAPSRTTQTAKDLRIVDMCSISFALARSLDL